MGASLEGTPLGGEGALLGGASLGGALLRGVGVRRVWATSDALSRGTGGGRFEAAPWVCWPGR